MKRLRQGQTVYRVYINPFYYDAEPVLDTIFLYSHKVPLPPIGQIIEKVPVNLANDAVQRGHKLYTSRRKAIRALKRAIEEQKIKVRKIDEKINERNRIRNVGNQQ
jgi:hypothetical protein